MFTVFGATGNTGSVVANLLLDRGKRVRAVARHPERAEALRARGAEIVAGDVTDRDAVVAALAGAEGAYLLVPPDPTADDFLARGRRVVDNYVAGLVAHRVPHAAVLSSVGAQVPSGTGLILSAHHAEAALPAATATRFTFVRAAFFMENLLVNAGAMKQEGVLPVFGGDGTHPFTMIATRDIGETAASALLAPPAETSWIELSGPRTYSYADAASEASKILGRPVAVKVLPLDAVVPTLTSFGMGASAAGLYREMTEASGKGLVAFEGKGRAVHGKTALADVLRPGLAG